MNRHYLKKKEKEKKKELELLNKIRKEYNDMLNGSLICKKCKLRNVDLRRIMFLRDYEEKVVIYCFNCHRSTPI